MSAVVLGKGGGSGGFLTIDITADVPPGAHAGTIHVFCGNIGPAYTSSSSILEVIDSESRPFIETSSTYPLVGLVRDAEIGPEYPDYKTLVVGSAIRTTSPDGESTSGDNIFITWATEPGFDVDYSAAIAVYIPAVATAVEQTNIEWDGTVYANSVSFPQYDGTSPTSLTWADVAAEDAARNVPSPDNDAVMVSVIGSYPGGAFSPLSMTFLDSVDGVFNLWCGWLSSVTALSPTDPGGSFDGDQTISVGNYQFMLPLGEGNGGGGPGATAALGYFKNGEWHLTEDLV